VSHSSLVIYIFHSGAWRPEDLDRQRTEATAADTNQGNRFEVSIPPFLLKEKVGPSRSLSGQADFDAEHFLFCTFPWPKSAMGPELDRTLSAEHHAGRCEFFFVEFHMSIGSTNPVLITVQSTPAGRVATPTGIKAMI
jgi:hypothetical protein